LTKAARTSSLLPLVNIPASQAPPVLGHAGDAYLLQARLNVSLPAWSAKLARRSSTPRTGPAPTPRPRGNITVEINLVERKRRCPNTSTFTAAASYPHRHRPGGQQFAAIGTATAAESAKLPTASPGTHQVEAGVLQNVGYARTALLTAAVILLHGCPHDIYSFVDVAPCSRPAEGTRVIVPYLRDYGSTLSFQKRPAERTAGRAWGRCHCPDGRAQIGKAIVDGYDWGARNGQHPSPRSGRSASKAMVSVSGYLIGSGEANKMPLPPKPSFNGGTSFYFATERGRAVTRSTGTISPSSSGSLPRPKWDFDDATFARFGGGLRQPGITLHRNP